MSGHDATYIGEGICVAETNLAICVDIDDEETWIPKSVIHEFSDVYQQGDEGEVYVQEWFADRM